jgi:hypothetical protein
MNVYIIYSEELTSAGDWQFLVMHTARNTFKRAKEVVRTSMKEYGSGEIRESEINTEFEWTMYSDSFVCTAKRIAVKNYKK